MKWDENGRVEALVLRDWFSDCMFSNHYASVQSKKLKQPDYMVASTHVHVGKRSRP